LSWKGHSYENGVVEKQRKKSTPHDTLYNSVSTKDIIGCAKSTIEYTKMTLYLSVSKKENVHENYVYNTQIG
jgi:hypothetical protein